MPKLRNRKLKSADGLDLWRDKFQIGELPAACKPEWLRSFVLYRPQRLSAPGSGFNSSAATVLCTAKRHSLLKMFGSRTPTSTRQFSSCAAVCAPQIEILSVL